MKSLPVLAVLVLTAVSSAVAAPVEPSKNERLEEIVSHYTEHRAFSGTVHARWGQGETFTGSGGLANETDPSNLIPNHASTRYLIASITKTYVATAILKLEDTGRLSVNDTLAQHFPEYPRHNLIGPDGTEVTLHHVLSHTGGLPSHLDEDGGLLDRFFRESISFKDVLDSVKDRPIKFSPGSGYEYSNTGYVLLGEIVRRTSGSPTFSDYLQSAILAPLKLQNTFINWPARNFARSYVLAGRGRRDFLTGEGIVDAMIDDTFTDGNVFATAADVALFFEALTSGRVLSPDAYARMITPVLDDYGYGVITYRNSEGRLIVMHNGSWIGFKAYATSYPEAGATIVYLSNQEIPDDVENDLRREIRDVVLGQ